MQIDPLQFIPTQRRRRHPNGDQKPNPNPIYKLEAENRGSPPPSCRRRRMEGRGTTGLVGAGQVGRSSVQFRLARSLQRRGFFFFWINQ